MLILHLSDLHLTGDAQTFDDAWLGPSRAIGSAHFDFIVVSGDLSQKAGTDEYKKLRAFVESKLMQLLKVQDHWRIVFVPGNHDVDWDAPIGEPYKPDRAKRVDLLRSFEQSPGGYEFRYNLKDGSFTKLDPARYNQRFRNAQAFLREFYDSGAEADGHRLFQLTHSDLSEHWSAHVFPTDRIAFYGFSSCEQNDRYWIGARINPSAVSRAEQHAREYATGCTLVAVWHHGLTSDQGRPDHLTLTNVGHLFNADFRVGLHGHVHVAEAEILDRYFLGGFAIVGTGSLGAGPKDRPDRVGNQFSTVRVYPHQVHQDVYERAGRTGVYSKIDEKRRLYLLPLAPPQIQPSYAREHRRRWVIDCTNGLAKVNVHLAGLDLRGPLTVGIVTPPYCSVQHEETLTTTTTPLRVNRHNLPDHRVQFELVGDSGHYESCKWAYSVSNSFALDRRDLDGQEARGRWLPRLESGEEARPHTVRIPCEVLKLVYEFECDEDVVEEGSGRVVVERPALEHSPERWDRVPEEEARGRVQVAARRVEFTIEAPLVGLRYTPVFRLKRRGAMRSVEAESIARDTLLRCRMEPTDPRIASVRPGQLVNFLFQTQRKTAKMADVVRTASALTDDINARNERRLPLSAFITRSIEQAVQKLLAVPPQATEWLGRDGGWVGMLWMDRDRDRLLFPAFGQFSSATWNVRFAYGSGVAGQSFRFCGPAAYVKDAHPDATSLIFQDRTEPGGAFLHVYEWILAFPLIVPGAAPIGVVSFAGTDHAASGAAKMYRLAHDIVLAKGWEHLEQRRKVLCRDLQDLMAAHFWKSLADRLELPVETQTTAESFVRSFLAPVPRRRVGASRSTRKLAPGGPKRGAHRSAGSSSSANKRAK
jgi:Calcineurin-like phosphoesterase